jgi:protocatechuate 3,4-dioxygenase beta subunit
VVAVGGGTVTGLAKALAVRTGVDQIILPTTYAGSELTPVLGETADGNKTTTSSVDIQPETVLYDVELTLGLSVQFTVASAANALAHAVETLYSAGSNPVTDAMALQAIEKIAAGLPRVVDDPSDPDARADLLRAAWLAGACLGSVGMGLHHKLCHVLGGSFGLPHAETHAVLLPHVMAFTAPAVPDVMQRIARALRAHDAPTGVFDLIASAGGPTSLPLCPDDLSRAAEIVAAAPYPHPRHPSTAEVVALLDAARQGTRPSAPSMTLTEQVVASFGSTPDPRARHLLTNLVRTLHGYVLDNEVTEREWELAIDFLTRTGQLCDDKRQEFMLLSDVLGVTSMVDLLTNSRTPDTTPSAVLGPFYVEGPPPMHHGDDISGGLPGTPLWIDVVVTDTAGNPLPGAVVDVWQSNEDGYYDVQLPDLDGPVLRGRFHTSDSGRLCFWSILPCEYPIPVDGPVGQLLDVANRHPFRAPHVHFLIQAPGHRRLVTQLFVRGGAYLDLTGGRGDTVFGVKEEIVVDFVEQTGPTPDNRPLDKPWRKLEYTFRVTPLNPRDTA